jgi:hypothetical protein
MGLIKNYSNTPNILPDYKLIGSASDDVTRNFPLGDIADFVHTSKYTSYVAKLKQSGTSAPLAAVMDSGTGTITWTRTSAGIYTGTLTGAFADPDKVYLSINNTDPSASYYLSFYIDTDDTIVVKKSNTTDSLNVTLEVRIYN